jgi:hypothetical protein
MTPNKAKGHMRAVQVTVVSLVLLFAAEASAGYKFCNRWVYDFWDSNLGEDYLTENGTTGNIDASWAWSAVYRDGNLVHSGYADSNGCTTETFTVSGNYAVRWYPAISRYSGQYFFVYLDANENWSYYNYDWGYVYGGWPGVQYNVSNSGGSGSTLAAVAAVVTRIAATSDLGIVNHTYKVHSDDDTCGSAISCYISGSGVFLGEDPGTGKDAFSKSIVGHEMGHYVKDKLLGTLDWDGYGASNPSNELCTCDHLTVSNSHCLQSREYFNSSLDEGWGHFFASNLFNNRSQSNGVFGYYKAFLNPGSSTPVGPPVTANVHTSYNWQDTYCSTSARGIELDWLGFFYAINNTGGSYQYTFTDIKNVYGELCGGACGTSDTETWSGLVSAVTSEFGPASGEYSHWVTKGGEFGVDN